MKKITGLVQAVMFLSLMTGCINYGPTGSGKNIVVPDRVIFICIDAMRFDRLTPEIAPNLYAFANNNTWWKRCYTAGSWTKPSMTSIFTGKWSSYAGVTEKFDPLPEQETTLAEILVSEGWTTIGASANIIVRKEKGFAQGFSIFHEPVNKPATQVITRGITAIENHSNEKLFLYLHLMDPHMPLKPPSEFLQEHRQGSGPYRIKFGAIGDLVFGDLELTESEIEQINGLYNAEVAYADSEVGRLFDWLGENEMWENSAIIVFADHGEELGDHGDWTHGHAVYQEITRVPLMAKFPGEEGQAIDSQTSLADLGGIILEHCGIDPPPEFETGSPCYTEGTKRNGEQKCIITKNRWKLIWNMDEDYVELYNLNDDPYETENLSETNRQKLVTLLEKLAPIVADIPEYDNEGEAPSEDVLEELRALGYIQ